MTARILPFRPRKPAPVQGDECQCEACVRPRWKPRDQCAMSVICEGVPADHGLMCAAHRAMDRKDNDHEQG